MRRQASPARAAGLFVGHRGVVGLESLDVNGHMNVSLYDQAFTTAEGRLFSEIGINEDSISRTGLTIFRLERVLCHERESLAGDRFEITSRFVWSDFRRIHHFHEMWNVGSGARAAFIDALSIHVDLASRRSAPIPAGATRDALERLLRRDAAMPAPEGLVRRSDGRRVS